MCYEDAINHKGIKIVISNCFGVGFDWKDEEFQAAVANREERLFEILEWMANGGAKRYNEAIEFEEYIFGGCYSGFSYSTILSNFHNYDYNLAEIMANGYTTDRAKKFIGLYLSGELATLAKEEKEKKKLEGKNKNVKRAGIIYLLKSGIYYKIGKTRNLPSRKETLTVGVKAPFDISLIHSFTSNDYSAEEKRLHELFSAKRAEGEWFVLEEKDIEYICSLRDEE